ncbi:hypothetical protein, partial [Duodenibacillus massiliensis]|uniref:hypothetical protein n=1 Tax=Duodenibacillus massiliensis TaxID=1852381 RepID=UPI003F7DB68E
FPFKTLGIKTVSGVFLCLELFPSSDFPRSKSKGYGEFLSCAGHSKVLQTFLQLSSHDPEIVTFLSG